MSCPKKCVTARTVRTWQSLLPKPFFISRV